MPTITKTLIGRGAAAALIATTLLVACAAPASAFIMQSPSVTGASHVRSGFLHHFYRGVPYQQTSKSGAADANMTAVVDADEMDSAVAYCADRFKSYDPSTGTYLGYDGYEHACP